MGTVGAHYTPNATPFTRVPLPDGGGGVGANETHGEGGLALTRRTGGLAHRGGLALTRRTGRGGGGLALTRGTGGGGGLALTGHALRRTVSAKHSSCLHSCPRSIALRLMPV